MLRQSCTGLLACAVPGRTAATKLNVYARLRGPWPHGREQTACVRSLARSLAAQPRTNCMCTLACAVPGRTAANKLHVYARLRGPWPHGGEQTACVRSLARSLAARPRTNCMCTLACAVPGRTAANKLHVYARLRGP